MKDRLIELIDSCELFSDIQKKLYKEQLSELTDEQLVEFEQVLVEFHQEVADLDQEIIREKNAAAEEFLDSMDDIYKEAQEVIEKAEGEELLGELETL